MGWGKRGEGRGWAGGEKKKKREEDKDRRKEGVRDKKKRWVGGVECPGPLSNG